MTKYEQDLTDKCTATHPNHQMDYQLEGVPWFWNVWCSICIEKGWVFTDARGCLTGAPNPEMSPDYLARCQAEAMQKYETQKAKSEQHRIKREARLRAKAQP